MRPAARALLRYLLPFVAVGLATAAVTAFGLASGQRPLAIYVAGMLLVIVVSVSATYGGLGPALVAVLLSAALVARAYTQPFGRLVFNEDELEAVVSVAVIGTGVAWLAWTSARDRRALAAANAQLRAVDAARRQFLQTVTHELQGPLTPILLQVAMLRARASDAAQRSSLDVVERNARRLSGMVAELLDAARVERGQLRIDAREVDLASIVAEVVEAQQAVAHARGIALTLASAAPLPVEGDPGRLAQVLGNLVGNALKFTPEGGRVEVLAEGRDARAVVEVRDTGAGLAPDQLAKLFQPFARAHEASGAPPGTGLGLFISKGIVERHGGRIWAASDGPGKGATFGVELPLARAAPKARPPEAARP